MEIVTVGQFSSLFLVALIRVLCDAVIEALPSSGKFFVTLDVDGLDPSVMPGTVALAPGGLMWWHIVELFEVLAVKG